MLTTSLISATLGLFGKKAKFIVTPKTSQKISFWFALKFQWKELLFSSILIVISLLLTKSVLPIILISATGFLSFALLFFSNKKYVENQVKSYDKLTSKITLSQNYLFKQFRPVNSSLKTSKLRYKNALKNVT